MAKIRKTAKDIPNKKYENKGDAFYYDFEIEYDSNAKVSEDDPSSGLKPPVILKKRSWIVVGEFGSVAAAQKKCDDIGGEEIPPTKWE